MYHLANRYNTLRHWQTDRQTVRVRQTTVSCQ